MLLIFFESSVGSSVKYSVNYTDVAIWELCCCRMHLFICLLCLFSVKLEFWKENDVYFVCVGCIMALCMIVEKLLKSYWKVIEKLLGDVFCVKNVENSVENYVENVVENWLFVLCLQSVCTLSALSMLKTMWEMLKTMLKTCW